MSKARTYALALFSSVQDGKDVEEKVARFRQLVKKRGDIRLLGSILREFSSLVETEKGKKARLVTADKLSVAKRKELLESFEGLGWQLAEEVHPEVIGGAALFLGDSVLIDGTVKKRLTKMFQ